MIPSQLALQTATQIAEKAKKKLQMPPFSMGLASPTTQQQTKPALQWNQPSLQAVSTAFGTAKTINNTPVTPKIPEKIPESGAKNIDYKSIATEQERQAFNRMIDDWIKPEEAVQTLKFAIDKRLNQAPEKSTLQKIATPIVRFARGVADVWAWIQEGIDTIWTKLWLQSDQTAINKKSREQDESTTQKILWKKAWYEKYVQEWWRIAWSFIANAPANKLWTLGKMAIWAAEWLLWWATYNLSTGEWVWSPVNLGLSTAIGAAVPWIVPAYKAIKWWWLRKVYNKAWELVDNAVEWIANPIMWTSKPLDKLFKAQEPRLNQLNKSIDYKKLRENSDIANIEILKAWYKPVDTATRAEAHYNTMKNIWNDEIASKIGKQYDIDLNPIADEIDAFVKEQKSAWLIKNEWQLKELIAQSKRFRKIWTVDGAKGEFIKEMINSQINNWWDSSIWDVYKNGMKKASHTLWQILDDTFSAIPWQFSEAKRRFWAMKATLQDVVKADIKNQRAKWLWIEDTFWRIEWFGDIAWALFWLVSWKNPIPWLASGWAKVLMWKVAKKLKDKDFLIQRWFEELIKNMKPPK